MDLFGLSYFGHGGVCQYCWLHAWSVVCDLFAPFWVLSVLHASWHVLPVNNPSAPISSPPTQVTNPAVHIAGGRIDGGPNSDNSMGTNIISISISNRLGAAAEEGSSSLALIFPKEGMGPSSSALMGKDNVPEELNTFLPAVEPIMLATIEGGDATDTVNNAVVCTSPATTSGAEPEADSTAGACRRSCGAVSMSVSSCCLFVRALARMMVR